MKKILIILAIVFSVLAIILAVLPLSNLAIFPAILSFIFGIIAFYISKKTGNVKKIIQFSFLLTTAALVLSIYKSIFDTAKVSEIKTLEAKEEQLEENAIQELEELDLDIENLEDISIE